MNGEPAFGVLYPAVISLPIATRQRVSLPIYTYVTAILTSNRSYARQAHHTHNLTHVYQALMAFIIAAGVRFAYKGVQSGIQAHKDFKSDQPPEVPVDRWGQPKDRNPVYGLVMKAEERFNGGGKGKGRDVGPAGGSSSASSSGGGQQREMNKEELESQGGEGSRTYRSYGPTVGLFFTAL